MWKKYYSHYSSEIFAIWHGGLAIHGAILAGGLTIYYYAKKKKLDVLMLLDIFAPVLVLGQAIGRWGNYFNQEIYGLPTNSFLGIPIYCSV
jgi:phosphatidylglycerol:prolipoprotein diacylglycerol transferase